MVKNSVLVTCGATVSFPGLISNVVNERVILKLQSLGYDRIIVQYGKDYLYEFKERVLSLEGAAQRDMSEIKVVNDSDNVWCGRWNGMEIDGFEFSNCIEEVIRDYVGLVISHAGTGSILDALRLDIPLIVVVNDTLMDNHQQLIAGKFEEQGLLWAVKACESEVLEALDKSCNSTLRKLGPAYNRRFEELVYNVAHR